ncbi:TauD/TfdA family dioxygenase [Polymorphospora sp. NPDC051019]|uniref:TauD/TfdA family dioxygenase n=1 Tax=Polymorphospora sp. NPDC051019 TaxID=3155725 RepID=UPI0034207B3C
MHDDQIPVLTGQPAPDTVLATLARHGAALLRDGGWRRETFVRLGDALMTPLPYDGAFHDERDVVGDDPTTTTVTRGTRGMPLHREASYAPGSPDLLTFLCERPAADGGGTTLCDGVALLAALPEPVRERFEQMEITWESRMSTAAWQQMFGTTDRATAQGLLRRWEPYLRPWESIHVDFTDEVMTTGFGTRCTPPTRFGAVPAFCNSLFISRPRDDEYRDQRLRVRTPAGTPVDDDLVATAAAAAADLTVTVPWQAGDILLVDNSRYLHGRQAFQDTGRAVLVRMGMLDRAAVTA